jgi:hypothetical protein
MTKIYSLYDNKVDAYNQPLFFKDESIAREALSMYLQSDEAKEINAVDYELFYLGEYDNQSGKFDLPEAPKHLLNLRQLENKEK